MADLAYWQYLLIGLLFVWSGFVRSGLGFGGAVLSLPFLLLILNEPLVFLPLIAVHLLIFSTLIAFNSHRQIKKAGQSETVSTIDWHYLKYALSVMIVPKLIGVLGLLSLSSSIMTSIIFVIVSVYALGYVINKPFRSSSKKLDMLFLILGGYISGTSLIGAPLIVAVFASHVAKHQLRDTLFVLWFILVVIKCIAFLWAGVDFNMIHHLWLLPCAAIGHVLGLRFHARMLSADSFVFYRVLGSLLLVVSGIGIWQAW